MQAVLWFGQSYHLCKTASPLMLLAILTDLRTMDLFWSVRFPWAKKTLAWLQWACKESLRSWSFWLILSCLTLPKTRCAAQSCVLTYLFLSDPSEDSLCSTIMCSDLSFLVWPFRRLAVQHNHVFWLILSCLTLPKTHCAAQSCHMCFNRSVQTSNTVENRWVKKHLLPRVH